MLIPWGLYCYKTTGHYLQKSTNGGHVLFISLGQLPNNKWGITPIDDDPKMKQILNEKFGDSINSLEYRADGFLTRKWLEYIISEPTEFIKKSIFNVYQICRSPFYIGDVEKNFFNEEHYRIIRDKIKQYLNEFSILELIRLLFQKKNYILFFTILINLWGIIIFLLFFYYLFRYLYLFKLTILTDSLSVIFLSLILYQLSLSIFTYFMPSYNSNIYIVYLLSLLHFRNKIQNPYPIEREQP